MSITISMIKNNPNKIRLFVISFVLSSIILIFIPRNASFAWFSEGVTKDQYVLNPKFVSSSAPTKTYVLRPNFPGVGDCFQIYPEPAKINFVCADRIFLDIPFSSVAIENFSIDESVDRLVIANLRIQELIDEYLLQNQKYEILLEELQTPYLDVNQIYDFDDKSFSKQRRKISSEMKKRKQELVNTVKYSFVFCKDTKKEIQDPLSMVKRNKNKEQKQTSVFINELQSDFSVENGMQPDSDFRADNRYDQQLPRIFRLLVSIVEFCLHHKTEMFFWSAVIGFFLSVIIILKAKQ